MADQRQEDEPAKLDLLDQAVNEALSADLEEAAEEVGLHRDEISRLAQESANEIFAPVERQFDRFQKSRQDLEALAETEIEERERRLEFVLPRRPPWPILPLLLLLLVACAAYVLWPLSTLELVVIGYFGAGSVVAFLRRVGRLQLPNDLKAEASEERVAATEAAFQQALVEEGARPWIRQQVNAVIQRQNGKELRYEDATGLAEVNEADAPMVTTSGLRRIQELMSVMPGGTIGVSGSRGVGKSTLIRDLCRQEEADSAKTLTAIVEAPVQYDGREFSLHLFARICEAVLGTTGVKALRDSYKPAFRGLLARRLRVPLLAVAGGIIITVVGLSLLLSGREAKLSPDLLGALLAIIGTTTALAGVAVMQREQTEQRRRQELRHRSAGGKDSATATQHLQDIWFQQSFSSGWSGALSLPLGLEGGVEAGWELAQKQLAFPDVVSRFRDFLEVLAAEHRILIGIDEMDKMGDQTARDFLNEIKALFRVKGCYFIVSVSDDAMTDFERRGMPFRDVFDSSFDEIVALENFSMKDSKKLIEDRVIGLPLPFIGLAHVHSAGLPRELIRVSRRLIRLRKGTPLSEATRTLAAEVLGVQARAVQYRLGQLKENTSKAGLLQWVMHPWTADQPVAQLRSWCEAVPIEHLLAGEKDHDGTRAKALESICELVLLGYFNLTTIEVFDRFVADEISQVQLAGSRSMAEGLGSVRQAFSISRGIAWSMLDAYREEMELETLGVRL